MSFINRLISNMRDREKRRNKRDRRKEKQHIKTLHSTLAVMWSGKSVLTELNCNRGLVDS